MEVKDIISSGILEMYVSGITTAEETVTVEQWANQYPEVAAEIRDIELSIENYAMLNAIAPPPEVKEKLLVALGKQANIESKVVLNTPVNEARIFGISPLWKWAAAASILLLIGSSIVNVIYYNKYKESDLAYEQTRQDLIAQNEKINDMNKDMDVVHSKFSEPVALRGLEAAPDAAAKIFWMKNTGEVYIDPSNLPETPEGMEYQLWGIVDGKPVDGGMIITKKGNKYRMQKMKTFGKAEAFAVTLETKGGNPTPKGQMYVMGKM